MLPSCEQTNTCENNTFPQRYWWMVTKHKYFHFQVYDLINSFASPDDGGLAYYKNGWLDEILQQIYATENETLKVMYNKTAWNVLGILEYFRDLDESIYSSFLFNFFHDHKNNYIDNFNSRRAHDLTRSLGHFEVWHIFHSFLSVILLLNLPCE